MRSRLFSLAAAAGSSLRFACCEKSSLPSDEATCQASTHHTSGSAIVTSASQYIKGIKIYGIGILEDPVPGEKRGKGTQHLTSSYWLYDMGVFIQREWTTIQTLAKYAAERSVDNPG